MHKHSVVITGIGLISSLSEGVEKHMDMLNNPSTKPNIDKTTFAPYVVHALGEVDWNLQIPKRSDQRQMEIWQRLGTYAAGLALDDAGLKNNEAMTATMDMIVAAGGGERDISVDAQILAKAREIKDTTIENRGVMLNQMLSTELRPTLFLAQLSNLLAGNISIVHKVTGSSRTFMGEEGSGLAAVEIAAARIRSGQSSHVLVGGSYNAQHYDMLLGQELGGLLKTDGFSPVWERQNSNGGGLITGSGGVFLVLESEKHAKARNAKIYATISRIITGQTNRTKRPLSATLNAMFERIRKDANFVISGASGVKNITHDEQSLFDNANISYRGITSLFGHMREAQFLLTLAIAAMTMHKKQAFCPLSANETVFNGEIQSIIASTIGTNRAEGMARLIPA